MKTIKIIMFIAFIILVSCNNNASYQQKITGKWIIKDIHPNDSKVDSNNIKEFFILNMLSSDGFFKFNKDSTFKTNVYNGKYLITNNGRNLTLKNDKQKETFNVNYKNVSILILNTENKRYSITLIKR